MGTFSDAKDAAQRDGVEGFLRVPVLARNYDFSPQTPTYS